MNVATDPPPLVLEAFAGPGGWSTGLAMLQRAIGRTLRSVGVEWDTAACKTAHAAGHTRVRADVARFDLTALTGLVWLLIMSPPCQAWSRSGKRKGILDQAAIFAHAMRVTTGGEWIDYTAAGPLPVGEGEAAVLQSFPPDYPWQGTKSAHFRQCGDAVPPLLAAHVIAACLGVRVESVERAA